MSRASKHLAKEKAKMKKAMGDYKMNCPSCGIPIPQDVFLKQDFGTKYRCKVCAINNFLDEHNYKSYYTRTWREGDEVWVDVGSWSEFFIVEDEEGVWGEI